MEHRRAPVRQRKAEQMPQQNNVYTVRELNERIKDLVTGEPWLGNVCVVGEISGFGRDKKNHAYFSLKDPSGVLSAVMFAGKQMNGLRFAPKDGDKVNAFGHIDVFVRDGKYQLYVDRLVRVGDGEVNAKLEKLMARLDGMGLFSQEYKKPIPKYPRRIGVVTAGEKAAISDIRAVAAKRDPYAQLICYPATVQGQYAAADIARGIEMLDSMGVDVIIVGRGGGSKENLWAFNEEQVAWAIFNAETPIVTATGHEIDNTVADLVADLRESNPSTAMTRILPEVKNTVAEFDRRMAYMESVMQMRLDRLTRSLEGYDRQLRLLSPAARMDRQVEQLDRIRDRLDAGMAARFSNTTDRCTRLGDRIESSMERKYQLRSNALAVMIERIHGLSPTAKLINGFGYIASEGDPVRSASDVEAGDNMEITLHDGRIQAVVTVTIKD